MSHSSALKTLMVEGGRGVHKTEMIQRLYDGQIWELGGSAMRRLGRTELQKAADGEPQPRSGKYSLLGQESSIYGMWQAEAVVEDPA